MTDWKPEPQTPEQVADGLKEAFREAVKQGVVSSSTKRQTLYNKLEEWYEFGNHCQSKDVIVNELINIVKDWLPKEHDTNSYKWNQCIRMIREKLR